MKHLLLMMFLINGTSFAANPISSERSLSFNAISPSLPITSSTTFNQSATGTTYMPIQEGIWISKSQILELPTTGTAWNKVKSQADSACGSVTLSDQDDPTNVCIMAAALVYARIGGQKYLKKVLSAINSINNSGIYNGRALALGRELAPYVISADLIELKSVDPARDQRFREKIRELRTTYTHSGPSNLVECHETRPNNWGLMCGGSRVAVAAYLEDTVDLDRAAKIFKGYLGDRSSYAGFNFGDDLSWQCDPSQPVGINPKGCTKNGHSIDGILPDDQRRGGSFAWPPPKENYVWEGLQGALAQAVILDRRGYDVWEWEDRALLRAVQYLHQEIDFPAGGDDTWQPHVINHFYGTNFPAPAPSRPGKNVGWTDWTHNSAFTPEPSLTCHSAATNSFTACYYEGRNFEQLRSVAIEPAINYYWGLSAPNNTLPNDNFSVRWAGNFTLESGDYQFNLTTDDGIRLFIDNELVFESWYDQQSSYQFVRSITDGQHIIRVEYYENSGYAEAKLEMSKLAASMP